jgi:hypothetical protein
VVDGSQSRTFRFVKALLGYNSESITCGLQDHKDQIIRGKSRCLMSLVSGNPEEEITEGNEDEPFEF